MNTDVDPSEDPTARSTPSRELHRPPVLVFLLPLVIVIAYAYFSR